jgi:hypothetical protein
MFTGTFKPAFGFGKFFSKSLKRSFTKPFQDFTNWPVVYIKDCHSY